MDRRNFISAAASAAMLVPAMAAATPESALVAAPAPDVIDVYWAAFFAHNEGLIPEREYMAAYKAMDEWEPRTARDFLRKFLARFDQSGAPTGRHIADMIANANGLLGDM